MTQLLATITLLLVAIVALHLPVPVNAGVQIQEGVNAFPSRMKGRWKLVEFNGKDFVDATKPDKEDDGKKKEGGGDRPPRFSYLTAVYNKTRVVDMFHTSSPPSSSVEYANGFSVHPSVNTTPSVKVYHDNNFKPLKNAESFGGDLFVHFITNVTTDEGKAAERFRASLVVRSGATMSSTDGGLTLVGERVSIVDGGKTSLSEKNGMADSKWTVFAFPKRFHMGTRAVDPILASGSPVQGSTLLAKNWPNMTSAFAAFQYHQNAQFQNRSWWTETKNESSGNMMGGEGKKYKVEGIETCVWAGVLTMQRTLKGTLENPAEEVAISGRLFSTCNRTMQLTLSRQLYFEEVVDEAADAGVSFGLLGIMLHAALVYQINKVSHSRGSTLRCSAISAGVLSHIFFYFAVAIITSAAMIPLAARAFMSGFFWWAAMVSSNRLFSCVVKVRAEEQPGNELLAALNKNSNLYINLSMIVTQVVLQSIPGLIPLASVALCVALLAPQIHLNFVRDDGIGVLREFVWASIISLCYVLYYIFLREDNFIKLPVNYPVGIICISLLVGQGCLLEIQRKYNAHAIIPPFLRPKRYSYLLADHPDLRHMLIEDTDCCICHMSLHPDQRGEDHAHQHDDDPTADVWVTPCLHFYHRECLLQWMEERMECPMCRKNLPKP